jgi:hypothetical protein
MKEEAIDPWGDLVVPVLKAVGLAFIVIVAINLTGSLTPKDRLLSVVSEANRKHLLDQQSNTDNDMFTECAMFYMAVERHVNIMANIFSTKFDMPKRHPCDGLRFLLEQHKNHDASAALPDITKYFYGARHIFSVLANQFSISQIRTAYFILSILSPLLLWSTFLIKSKLDFITISPLIISMLIGFDVGNMGGNIAHSPGFFLPIICLAGVVLWRNSLVDLRKRVFVYAVIASLTTYLDILHGPLPFILLVTILINHMLYHPIGFAITNDRRWFFEAVGLIVLFISVFVLLIILKLIAAAPFVNYNVFYEFYEGLMYRLSSSLAGRKSLNPDLKLITHSQVWSRLWFFRDLYFFHSVIAATAYYLLAGFAWILTLIILITHRVFKVALPCWREIVVLAIALSGIMVWYFEFVNHTYKHALFMGRLGIIPASAGAMALIYLGRCRWDKYLFRLGWALGVSIAPTAAILIILYPPLTISGMRVDYASKLDAVSCNNSPLLKPDGVKDVNLTFNMTDLPSFVNFRINSISLERNFPSGKYSTDLGSFPLGVLDKELKILNKNRSDHFMQKITSPDFNLLFCADGADMPDSKYRVVIDTNFGIVKSYFFDL